MANKVHAHKRQNGGLEYSRNNVELQLGKSQIHYPERELAYSCQVQGGWSKNSSYSNVASVKRLNNKELSKKPGTRSNTPSLVARLMGIDMMPLDTKSVVTSDENISGNMERKFSEKGMNGKDSVCRSSSNFNSYGRMEFDSFYQDIEDDGWGQNYGKPRPREHPQEEELQKFKKEFEAYQEARFKECLKDAETGSVSGKMLAQENLNKEMVQNGESSLREATKKSAKLDNHLFKTELLNDDMMNLILTKQKQSYTSRDSTMSRDFEESLIMESRSGSDICSSPSQIVILKPSADSIYNCNHKENGISSLGTLQGRNSIEEFLEEVGERLKRELQGKSVKKGSAGRGSGIETPYYEKLSDPKEIAHDMAKEIRESVTRDGEVTLIHSKSTNKLFSTRWGRIPELFNRDTRKFFSKRLRNVMKSAAYFDIPEMTEQEGEILRNRKDIRTGSFRHETNENLLSPGKLIRSLSAPAVSGTSFEKLLIENPQIVSGAHALIQRKLEAVETMPKKQKKDRFKFKEKVSSFKHAFDLRRKLFGKRVHSMVESHCNESGPIVRDIRSGATVLMNYGERHENSPEVPPSPASVCSLAQEELWTQTEYLSPISTPCVSSRDDIAMPKDFRDIISGLKELRRQIGQLESYSPEDLTTKQEPLESELVQLEDPAESYVRDLLVASGLYFGSWGQSLSKGDTFAKPIRNSDFEEVEESHKKLIKENGISIKDQNHENKLEHMVLLDLLNEALSIVLGPPLTLSRFRRKLSNSSMEPPPCGKELLKLVWDNISVSLHPSSNTPYSQDLRSISWYELINDQINVIEREIAYLIADDLVEEFTNNMLLGIV